VHSACAFRCCSTARYRGQGGLVDSVQRLAFSFGIGYWTIAHSENLLCRSLLNFEPRQEGRVFCFMGSRSRLLWHLRLWLWWIANVNVNVHCALRTLRTAAAATAAACLQTAGAACELQLQLQLRVRDRPPVARQGQGVSRVLS